MKFTTAAILVLGIIVTVIGKNTDEPSDCETYCLGKPDDEDWSTPQDFEGTIEVTLKTGNRDWSHFYLGFDSEDRLPIGYLQMEKKGHAIDVTLRTWDSRESSSQIEKQNITAHTQDLFVKWTTITLQRLEGYLRVAVDKVFELTFAKVNAAPFKFVYAYVQANQYINVTLNCKRHDNKFPGERKLHDQPNRPETVTSINLSPPTSSRIPELEAGITTVTVVIILILLVFAVTGISGGYCFWKKGSFHTFMKDKDKQEDDTDGVNHTLLSPDPNATTTGYDTNSTKDESLKGFSELFNKGPDLKTEDVAKISEGGTKLEPEEDRNPENISKHLNESPDSEITNKTPQTEDNSSLQYIESQIIPRKISIPKMDMNCHNNIIVPIPEQTPLSVEQVQNHTDNPSVDEVTDALATLSIDEHSKQDNHGTGKGLGNNTEGFPLDKKDTQNECTSANKQTTQASPQNSHPEITNHDYKKIEVHEEPVTHTVIIKIGETEGTVPTRLEEIQSSTTIQDTEYGSPKKDHNVL